MEEDIKKELKKIERQLKITEILYFILGFSVIIFTIIKFCKTKNSECLITLIWIVSAMMNFYDYTREKKWSQERLEFRDNFIKILFAGMRKKQKELDRAYEKINNVNKYLESLNYTNENIEELKKILND